MAWIESYILNLASSAVFGYNMEGHTEQEDEPFPGVYSSDRYKPSVSDVLAVKEALHNKSKLPYELVDTIVDIAEYWPHTTTKTMFSKPTSVIAGRSREEERFIVSLSNILTSGHYLKVHPQSGNHSNIKQLRSYPLGYLPPTNENPQENDIAFQDAQRYQTLKPQPWPESNSVPDEATNEVLSNWVSRSQPKGEYPCRKIVFTIKSHDQGWGGQAGQRGAYEGSYSWFEAGLERMTACPERQRIESVRSREPSTMRSPEDPPPLPEDERLDELSWDDLRPIAFPLSGTPEPFVCNLLTIIPSMEPKLYENTSDTFHHDMLPSPTFTIQKNVVATKQTKEHKVTWACTDNVVPDSLDAVELEKQGRGRESADGEFVRNMKLGDVITVWAKARFTGWANHIEEVKIDVYWAM